MTRNSKGALRPKSEAPRQTRAGVERGTTNYFSNSNAADTTTTLRLQRLLAYGIVGRRAILIASLAWGAATNG